MIIEPQIKYSQVIDENLKQRAIAIDALLLGQEVTWVPQEGSAQLFLACPYWEVLYAGTRGCGKTDSLLMDFAQHVGSGFGMHWRGILFRETYKQLEDLISKTKRWFYQIFPNATYNESNHTWTWPDGEQLLLRYMRKVDDYWNYHGHEYPWIGWEELTNWPFNDCYEAMKACNRSSYPGMPRKYRSTTNPWGVGHAWVKSYFVDPAVQCTPIEEGGKTRVRIQGTIYENRILLKVDPDYLVTLQNIRDPNLREAWLTGSWDIIAGGALTDIWDENIHFIQPFVIPIGWRVDRSFDWGSSKPFSVGWWAESDGNAYFKKDGSQGWVPKGTVFRIGEFYGWNGDANKGSKMATSEIARKIREAENSFSFPVVPGPADPSIWTIDDGDSHADKMARQGITWVKADNSPGSRVAGLETLRELLYNSTCTPMESKGIFIFNNCAQWKRTVPPLPRDEKKMDDVDCFVAGTLIDTINGQIPIEKIDIDMLVETPIGFRKVIKAGLSGYSDTISVTLSNGVILKGTPDHKVLVEGKGLIPLCLLKRNNVLLQKELSLLNMEGLSSESMKEEDILNVVNLLPKSLDLHYFIESFGQITTELFQKEIVSTIKTTNQIEMKLKILNVYFREIMLDTISKKEYKKEVIWLKQIEDFSELVKVKRSLEKILRNAVKILLKENLRVLIVLNILLQNILDKNFVLLTAKKNKREMKNNVLSVMNGSIAKHIKQKKLRPVVMYVVGNSEKEAVYNLTVEQAHLFFANGITSSNSDTEDHCFDNETEILTDSGWKLFKDLDKTEKVATLTSDNKLVYQKPFRYISRYYEGDMYEYTSKKLNFCITLSHRLPVINQYSRKVKKENKWELKKIKDVNYNFWLYITVNCDAALEIQQQKLKVKQYKGRIFCVSVDNTTIFVRRKGTPFWSGNCYDETRYRVHTKKLVTTTQAI